MIPPSAPNITRLSDESVMVRWDVVSDEGLPIQFFKVQYKELDRGKWNTIDEDIPSHIRSYEVDNLKTEHNYKYVIKKKTVERIYNWLSITDSKSRLFTPIMTTNRGKILQNSTCRKSQQPKNHFMHPQSLLARLPVHLPLLFSGRSVFISARILIFNNVQHFFI